MKKMYNPALITGPANARSRRQGKGGLGSGWADHVEGVRMCVCVTRRGNRKDRGHRQG